MRSVASSISGSVNIADKLNRIAERNRASETPIASNTGDGNKLPDEHAEPVEHAIPAKSKLTSKTSDRQPRNERFTVVGKQSRSVDSGEFSTMFGIASRNFVTNRVRSASSFARLLAISRTATSSAVAMPTARATGSVPGRKPFC